MKLLIVEDDLEISELLKSYLESEGFSVSVAYNGKTALEIFQKEQFDLLLLDLMIPLINGLSVMKQIRSYSVIPIIIISAKDSDSDKTIGLGFGADDYITKPFSMTEVLARIKAQIRRTTQYAQKGGTTIPGNELIKIKDIVINLENYTVYKKKAKLDLTNKEFQILKLLAENPHKVYTKAQIYTLIWNETYMSDENAVNVHISRLRNKIEDDPKVPQYILTVWGIGYKLGDFSSEGK